MQIIAYLKYWPYALIAVLALSLGVQTYRVKSLQLDIERQQTEIAKHAVKASKDRDAIENENSKISSGAIDKRLTAGGWMRSN